MGKRDPLLDPRPGDVVISTKLKTRRVVYVTFFDQVIYDSVDYPHQPQKIIDLKTWQRWAKGGKVQVRGCDEDQWVYLHATYGKPVMKLTPEECDQVRAIANRVMNENPDRLVITTPFDETLRTVFQVGLAYFLQERGRRGMKDRIAEQFPLKEPFVC